MRSRDTRYDTIRYYVCEIDTSDIQYSVLFMIQERTIARWGNIEGVESSSSGEGKRGEKVLVGTVMMGMILHHDAGRAEIMKQPQKGFYLFLYSMYRGS